MPERKPFGTTWERWTDRLIREAQERGEFDDLPGSGRPLSGLDAPHDPDWWLRQLAEREGLATESPALELLRDVERELEALGTLSRPEAVRARIRALNDRIRRANATTTRGAPTQLPALPEDALLARWAEARAERRSHRRGGSGTT